MAGSSSSYRSAGLRGQFFKIIAGSRYGTSIDGTEIYVNDIPLSNADL